MRRRYIYSPVGLLALLALAGGCASTAHHPRLPAPRPLAAQYESRLDSQSADVPSPAVATGVLALDQALTLAMMHNPALTAVAYDVRAAEALRLQARRLPNPKLEFEVEEYDRDGAGFDSSESVVAISQPLELGGKRRWRRRVAEAHGELAGWAYEQQRLEVFSRTTDRFVAVIAAQQGVALAASTVELAEQTHRAVAERVEAGKEPELQASKAEAELEVVRLSQLEAESRLSGARLALVAMWGAQDAAFDAVEGSLELPLDSVPALEDLKPRLVGNPVLARWESELRMRQAKLGGAKAARIPDLKAKVGYSQYEEDGTDAFAFGVGMLLPVFDRNQGGVVAAELALARAETERDATATAMAIELTAAHTTFVLAQKRVVALRGKVVPAMQNAFDVAAEGYRLGKFGLLDMLDAQRKLIETRVKLLDAWSDYQSAQNAINRLVGPAVDVEAPQNQENK
jgi:cobalt-zinc-cadmium efflux system outer membrane protein